MTDNVAVLEGFTREILIETPERVIFALVRPDTKFTGLYRAWDTDAQEFVKIKGRCARWNMAYGEDYN
jgi:hypothetical protein